MNSVVQMNWAPTNNKQLLLLTDTKALKIVNVETSVIDMIPVDADVTAVRWHPRHASKILVGTEKGTIYLYNLEKRQFEMNYTGLMVPNAKDKNSVIDLLFNPGEDVFLALFKHGDLRLYSQNE